MRKCISIDSVKCDTIMGALIFVKKIVNLLNPFAFLGIKRYSIIYSFVVSVIISILSEIYANWIVGDPMAVGTYIILVNVLTIIYFSFRDGIRGGLTAVAVSVAYYFYIIYTREYEGSRFVSGVETTVTLGVVYSIIAFVIGFLKQQVDNLIEREADQRRNLQAIIDQLPVGVVVADRNGKVTHANKFLETLLKKQVPIGYTIKNNAPLASDDHTHISEPLFQTITTGKPVKGKEISIHRPDGKLKHVLLSTSLVHNKKGKIIAAASILNDVTQQKEIESRKDDFVNMASHELKTPITSMKLYLESLTDKITKLNDQKATKILNSIKYQTKKLEELVTELLDITRIQTGKLLLSKEKFSLNDLISETVSEFQGSTPSHEIQFVNSYSTNIYADKFRIYQVLTNLLTNAIKYSPGHGKIKIGMQRNNTNVIVYVKDQGIGIRKEEYKKIFDRLYQVTSAVEKTFPGLGIGLFISKEIISKHNGSIWVESSVGKGSTFYFSLPLKKEK